MPDYLISEKSFYDQLISETTSTDKKNAFLGKLPDITNAWALIPQSSIGDFPCINYMPMYYEIFGRFSERSSAMAFRTMIIEYFQKDITPSNVLWNSLEGLKEPKLVWNVLYGQKRKTAHWELRLTLFIQFDLT